MTGGLSQVTNVRELELSALPECRSSSRRWRSVVIQLGWMMHHWAIGKRQKQGYFSLIITCLIWCSTLFCRYMLSFSARGFIPSGLPLQLLLLCRWRPALRSYTWCSLCVGDLGDRATVKATREAVKAVLNTPFEMLGHRLREGRTVSYSFL